MGKVHEREVFKDSPKSFLFIYSLKPNRVNSISISPEKPKSQRLVEVYYVTWLTLLEVHEKGSVSIVREDYTEPLSQWSNELETLAIALQEKTKDHNLQVSSRVQLKTGRKEKERLYPLPQEKRSNEIIVMENMISQEIWEDLPDLGQQNRKVSFKVTSLNGNSQKTKNLAESIRFGLAKERRFVKLSRILSRYSHSHCVAYQCNG